MNAVGFIVVFQGIKEMNKMGSIEEICAIAHSELLCAMLTNLS